MQLKLNNNIKIAILIVCSWMLVSILTSLDTKNQTRSPPPMFYYTSLVNDPIRKRQKMDNTKIDTRLIENINEAENSDTDIFYDVDNGNVLISSKSMLIRISYIANFSLFIIAIFLF